MKQGLGRLIESKIGHRALEARTLGALRFEFKLAKALASREQLSSWLFWHDRHITPSRRRLVPELRGPPHCLRCLYRRFIIVVGILGVAAMSWR